MNLLLKLDSFSILMEIYCFLNYRDILNLLITNKSTRNITLNNNKIISHSIIFNLKYFKSQNGKAEDKSYNKDCMNQITKLFQRISELRLESSEPCSIDESLFLLSNDPNIKTYLEDLFIGGTLKLQDKG